MPKPSAIYGLPDDKEVVVKINADHGDICRFDMKSTRDKENFRRVWNALEEMYGLALQQGESEAVSIADDGISQVLGNLPSVPHGEPNGLIQ